MSNAIVIKGARQHNLKNIDLEIPRDKLVVITGLSGSGKSSLAFDTIYAEGQRRYVESLSAYARQFLEQMDKPDVDAIEGLSPAISIEQKGISRNPRSTVGTVTEIYDYLRLLFARVGRPHCYQCGQEISSQTIPQIVDQIMEFPPQSKIIILAPIIRGKKGEFRKDLEQLRKKGFVRARIDGAPRELDEEIVLDKNKKHQIEVVVDRLSVKEKIEKRLSDSLETALTLSGGIVKIEDQDGEGKIFSEKFACIDCGVSYSEITPRMFSFNSPYGACPECGGLGNKLFLDPELIAPNPELSIREGALDPWAKRNSVYFHQILDALSEHYQFDIYTPFKKLPDQIKHVLLYGSGEEKIKFYYDDEDRRHFFFRPFEGIIPNLDRRFKETNSDLIREEIERYMNIHPCPVCQGSRLKPESLFVKLSGKSIYEVSSLSITQALYFFESLKLDSREKAIAHPILKEILARLKFMTDMGLDYLTLHRSSATLSGGEGQRIRLATQIGSGLMGVLYILDEPSIGLHQRDNNKLINNLKRLRDLGNTVLVVEHDENTIVAADQVIDMGPGAGVNGGEVVFSGTPQQLMGCENSLTGQYLSGSRLITVPQKRRCPDNRFFTIKGARENNLKDLEVRFPVGILICVTGVSGSGKSTLIIDTLYRALAQKFCQSKGRPGKFLALEGLEYIDKVIDIDQSPIGRTPRSNPATYTGAFTFIRELFAVTPEAKVRGYKAGRFSFNVKGGRCEACCGDGLIKIEMHFLPDVYVTCDECKGKRYNRDTLEVVYKGKSIAEVLDMTVSQALDFFSPIPRIREKLQTLTEVGLGYITLGQSAPTLSGGEAQRIKLSRELSKRSTGRTLYLLDEPTTGLHFADVQNLLEVLNRLTDRGNTIIIIEHNLEVIKTADYVIDLGPEGGDKGGYLVACGTPEEVIQNQNSYTGNYLKSLLEKQAGKKN
ncbi:MAG: excinuclease ABC subunit UvrA [Thermodesulfobacteriota bacterium]|jgi:excinuclease ABC subunit A|nr:MAG: excinuclease ABC subunit UvrA [Thermodesulfobacteriota bacterium]